MSRDHPQELLLKTLEVLTRPWDIGELADELGVERETFARFTDHLVARGVIMRDAAGRVSRSAAGAEVGYLAGRKPGVFYIIPDAPELPLMDVDEDSTAGALAGDRVLFHYRPAASRRSGRRGGESKRYEARVVSIIAERPALVTGIYELDAFGDGVVQLRGKNKPKRVMLEIDGETAPRPGELVRVELPRRRGPRGSIGRFLEVVSDIETPDDDVESIAALYGLETDFSEEVMAEVEALPDDPVAADFRGRLDLRELAIITIDPADAKDHDDAISVEELPGGLTRVGIHIADVSHYVTPGSALAREAFERSCSTYLPGKTIPMLPLKLSAGLCSLMDGRERLAKSCFLTFDGSGRELRREMYPSVIEVKRFLNYNEALAALEGRLSISSDIDALLTRAARIAAILRRHRVEGGSVTLTIDRPHLILDDEGRVASIDIDRGDQAHHLIEEFMLAANRTVARFLIEHELPYIGRIHPSPSIEAEEEFAEFCVALGVAAPSFEESRRVQLFLDGLKGRPGEHAIHLAILRSMRQAIYSHRPDLHYALAFREYTHFTSPIRRLCDLFVHQVLGAWFASGGSLKAQERSLDLPWMDGGKAGDFGRKLAANDVRGVPSWRIIAPAVARQASEREHVSSKAEIEATQLKLLRLMQDNIGDQYEGSVTHIGAAGVVVQLDGTFVEGTIFYPDLSGEWITPRKFWIEYESRGEARVLRVGDRLKVAVQDVNLGARTLRLVPPEDFSREAVGVSRPRLVGRGPLGRSDATKKGGKSKDKKHGKGKKEKKKRKGKKRRKG